MAEYIEREAVLKAYEDVQRLCRPWRFESLIESVPAADVEPVVHGRWIVEHEESIRCSECCFNRANIKIPMDYCPNCGARMD